MASGQNEPLESIEDEDEYMNNQFVLVAEIKYRTGNTWIRVFGPFSSRAKAINKRKKLIRDTIEKDWHTPEWVVENVKFTTTTLWTDKKKK
jgi:hypothetical protein